MKIKPTLIVLGLVCGATAQAKDGPKTSSKDMTVKSLTALHPLMYQMLGEMTALQPLLVSEARFVAKENRKEIEKRLTELGRLSAQVMVQKQLQSPTYRISGEALNLQIQHASRAFKSGNAKYARWALASVPAACSSCHTQGVSDPKPLWNLNDTDLAGPPLERADFLFATRNYDPAETTYSSVVRTFEAPQKPGGFSDTSELDHALRKKLMIWVRVRRDLKGAKESLERDLKNQSLPAATRNLISGWIKELVERQARAKKESALKGEPLLALVRSRLPSDSGAFNARPHAGLVDDLWLSGLLYEQLNSAPEGPQTAEYLYWLALIDLGLNSDQPFISLGQTYLRDCVARFAASPVTKRCYAEYEQLMTALYSGSRGTDLPPEVQDDLRTLKTKAGVE